MASNKLPGMTQYGSFKVSVCVVRSEILGTDRLNFVVHRISLDLIPLMNAINGMHEKSDVHKNM